MPIVYKVVQNIDNRLFSVNPVYQTVINWIKDKDSSCNKHIILEYIPNEWVDCNNPDLVNKQIFIFETEHAAKRWFNSMYDFEPPLVEIWEAESDTIDFQFVGPLFDGPVDSTSRFCNKLKLIKKIA